MAINTISFDNQIAAAAAAAKAKSLRFTACVQVFNLKAKVDANGKQYLSYVGKILEVGDQAKAEAANVKKGDRVKIRVFRNAPVAAAKETMNHMRDQKFGAMVLQFDENRATFVDEYTDRESGEIISFTKEVLSATGELVAWGASVEQSIEVFDALTEERRAERKAKREEKEKALANA